MTRRSREESGWEGRDKVDGKGGISFIRSLEDEKWMAVDLLGSGKGRMNRRLCSMIERWKQAS